MMLEKKKEVAEDKSEALEDERKNHVKVNERAKEKVKEQYNKTSSKKHEKHKCEVNVLVNKQDKELVKAKAKSKGGC